MTRTPETESLKAAGGSARAAWAVEPASNTPLRKADLPPYARARRSDQMEQGRKPRKAGGQAVQSEGRVANTALKGWAPSNHVFCELGRPLWPPGSVHGPALHHTGTQEK